ncbi:phage repressor protein C with HTH and peptisase S24 domain [Ectopseudomonas oleovorans]|uniref:Phage repressor protein C with HTH and peptisase S24 domain n=1 Tax=Ectopseudomonas oleovorans TaxID=301 RepID=A0A3D9EVP0_ECTOL|nr:phage repressor protein C with HTH and peptisase S24 domain [Pseudomonas oleovorans]
MDIYQIRKANLIQLIGSQRKGACATRWGMSPAHLSQILSDKTEKNLGDDVARRIEQVEGLQRGWMDTGHSPRAEPSNVGQPIPITSPFRPIPIVGIAQLGAEGYWTALSPSEGHINFPTQDKDAYALRLRGDSMSPAIRSGWVAIIEPNGDLVPGEYVYIKLHGVHDEGESMVKELLRADDYEVSLMSVNDAFGRRSIPWEQIQHCYPVGAIVPPSKIVQ